MLRPKDLLDLPRIHFQISDLPPPGRIMLIGPEAMYGLSILAIDNLFGRKTEEEVNEEIAALAGAAVRDRKVVLIKNIGKESGNHGSEEKTAREP